jgi:hypothetical protein
VRAAQAACVPMCLGMAAITSGSVVTASTCHAGPQCEHWLMSNARRRRCIQTHRAQPRAAAGPSPWSQRVTLRGGLATCLCLSVFQRLVDDVPRIRHRNCPFRPPVLTAIPTTSKVAFVHQAPPDIHVIDLDPMTDLCEPSQNRGVYGPFRKNGIVSQFGCDR